jgi:hypothetical protein
MEALLNLADVFAELWPFDDTPRILHRILVHYNFAAGIRSGEAERCRIAVEFCDTVLRDNAIRALVKDTPLSYRQAKERWLDVTERYTTNVFVARGNTAGGGGGAHRQQNSAGGVAAARPAAGSGFGFGAAGSAGSATAAGAGTRGGFQRGSRNARFFFGGKSYPVCFDFNRASCNRKPGGCGCEDAKGSIFAHVCNYYNFTTSKFCLANHTRVGNH